MTDKYAKSMQISGGPMKTAALAVLMLSLAPVARATHTAGKPAIPKESLAIPHRFQLASETEKIHWGCPLQDVFEARSGEEALQKARMLCMEEVERAAVSKPHVSEVLQTSVIWPDVVVSS